MKQFLFIAAAATMALTACTQDEGYTPASESDLVPIQIGLSAPSKLATRGSGTVGSTDEENSKWWGQKVNVYMFEKGTLTLAADENGPIYDNASFTTPSDMVSGIATFDKAEIKYYPVAADKELVFDFWGYRVDNAATGAVSVGETQYTVPFTIDGSQDLMVAKADPEVDKEGADNYAAGKFDVSRCYSSYSARHGVKPELVFKHLLTRLTFQAVAGSESVCDQIKDENGDLVDNASNVRIKSVVVKSKATGELVVAYTGDDVDRIVWSDDDPVDLTLMKRPEGAVEDGVEKEPLVPLDDKGEAIPNSAYCGRDNEGNVVKDGAVAVGEALLVAPSDSYDVVITFVQNVSNGSVSEDKEFPQAATLTLNNDTFKAGYSYTTTIVVYGLEQIQLITTLSPWEDGGDTNDIDPDLD